MQTERCVSIPLHSTSAGRVVLPNCAWEKTSHSKNNLGQNGLQAARVRGGQQKHVRKASSTSAPHFRRVVAQSSSAHANAGFWQRLSALIGDAATLRTRPDLPEFLECAKVCHASSYSKHKFKKFGWLKKFFPFWPVACPFWVGGVLSLCPGSIGGKGL